jgi:biopolymer transport protein ExbD
MRKSLRNYDKMPLLNPIGEIMQTFLFFQLAFLIFCYDRALDSLEDKRLITRLPSAICIEKNDDENSVKIHIGTLKAEKLKLLIQVEYRIIEISRLKEFIEYYQILAKYEKRPEISISLFIDINTPMALVYDVLQIIRESKIEKVYLMANSKKGLKIYK